PVPKVEMPIEKSSGPIIPTSLDPCGMVLAPHSGDTRLDREIVRLQRELGQSAEPATLVERLGWMFVSKARITFEDRFYTRAEQCALCLTQKTPGSPEAMLLRGHILHSLHRFKEAEPLARQLTVSRGTPFDFGLLG